MFLDCSPVVLAVPVKVCSKCGEVKPREEFRAGRAQCRACDNKSAREYYQANSARIHDQQRGYRQANTERIREKDRKYREMNAERIHEYYHEYYNANTERKRDNNRKYRKKNIEYLNERIREYRQTPSGKAARAASHHRRRARKRSLSDTLTTADWQAALDYFGGCCAACGRPPGLWHKIVADHWIPLSKGGPTTPDNIVPLCHGSGGCNNSKHHRLPTEWLTEQFGQRKGRVIQKRIEAYLATRQSGRR